ncbi:aldose epimerase family protein [Actinacidiphila paucisporea]|uniref:Aldose 1-epimerase n=1 Tax=Actinacidiphila paucisporea TaxID=310782 RepID=A0A1M7QET5_9ACTN|nr:aldose epimerase family protein [Actinacidiphila paucisporea]SHN29043.1 aldose 1-epimerase [Actinacidiphila paucisporea]
MPDVSCSLAGTLGDGRTVHRWRLVAGGVRADILTLGASLHALAFPDRTGRQADVVVTPHAIEDKLTSARYLGATVGRYANRIAHGRVPGPEGPVRLSVNENGHTLHGGPEGFDLQVWNADPFRSAEDAGVAGVALSLVSPAGDQGFPGTVDVTVRYSLSDAGELRIDYSASTDASTPFNLTNHAYWNLSGNTRGSVGDHELYVSADCYTPVDTDLVPLPGPPRPVAGTPFDLTTARPLADVLDRFDDGQLALAGGGYDHNWVLRGQAGRLRLAAVLGHPPTGRVIECLTTEPGLQVYTANTPHDPHGGDTAADETTAGRPLFRHSGVALESQHFPNSPNRPDYPPAWLRPGHPYRSTTIYRTGLME